MLRSSVFISGVASTLTVIVGIVLTITASLFVSDTINHGEVWGEIFALSIVSIVIGGLTIIFASGLLYVVNRHLPALTKLFSILIFIVLILSAICLIILALGLANLQLFTFKSTKTLLRNYSNSDDVVSSKKFIGHIQQTFQCCGVESAVDWKIEFPGETSTPDSCCVKVIQGCGINALNTTNGIYKRGCAEPLYRFRRRQYIVLISINAAIIVLVLTCATFGFISERSMRQYYEAM